ncbi:MAG: monovalent cation/H+ antiporter subunit A [Acetobacteraceae bacterium]
MTPNDLLLIAVVALPFAGSLLVALLPAHARNGAAWLTGSVALAELAMVAAVYPAVTEGHVIRRTITWLPKLDLNFILRMDGLAWVFAALIAGIGLFVIIYARYYMSCSDPVPRLFSFLLAFMGAMLGLVLSGNLIQLVFFWELTSLFSFVLIGYWHHNVTAREGARTALIVTGTGGLCLLAAVLILGHIVGSYDLDAVLSSGGAIRASALYRPALALILLGAFTKSAQFPFQFWLPQAMAAPTPVSAYLHSATLVKAGVFLLARLWPVLAGTDAWFWTVGSIGLATLLLGAYLAIFQHDLKGLLAYSTISNLGLITLLLGLDNRLALVAAIFHIINHATFKASLFMAAGIIDHGSGTRDLRRLSGLWHFMPVTATLAMVAAAAMAGVPLLNGFLSKEMFFAETVASHVNSVLDDALPYIATLAGIFTVTYSVRFIHDVFFGPPPKDLPRTPQEPPRWMRFPVEVLVLICLVVGLIPAVTVGPFLATAVRAVLGAATPHYSLAIWHGLTLPLLMSAIALSGGVALYLLLHGVGLGRIAAAPVLGRVSGGRIFGRVLVVLSVGVARPLTELLSTRRLQPQLRLLVCTAAIAAAWPLWRLGFGKWRPPLPGFDPAFALLWAVGITCAIGAVHQAKYHRLAALMLLSGTGLVTVVTFVWLSAPDLALTQLLVETVTLVLLLLGLRWLPRRIEDAHAGSGPARQARRLGDFAIACVAGGGLAALAYAAMTRPAIEGISRYFIEHAHSKGGGNNIVNVILVDFRGFDTLGEITVVGTVALAVFALLRRFRPAPDSIALPPRQRDDARPPPLPVPMLLMRLLFPVIGLVALFLLLRGHDLPGGGFVAGLTMAVAFLVQYMAGGARWVEARLRIHPVRWMGAGLLLAAGAGAGAWGFARPFLTAYSLPLVGTIALPSVLVFDAGVFALVVGAVVLVLAALAHQSIRTRPPTRSAEPEER